MDRPARAVLMVPKYAAPPLHYNGAAGPAGPGPSSWAQQLPAAHQANRRAGGRGASRKSHQPNPLGPSLSSMKKENAKKARRHFKRAGATPWTVPRAPEHPDFSLVQPGIGLSPAVKGLFHTYTPSTTDAGRYWKNQLPMHIDSEALEVTKDGKIDLFGSNMGLFGAPTHGDSGEESDDDPYGFDLCQPEEEAGALGVTTDVQQRLDEQQAYIHELEDANGKLKEQVWLLEQQLEALRADRAAGVGNGTNEQLHSGDDEHEQSGTEGDGQQRSEGRELEQRLEAQQRLGSSDAGSSGAELGA